MRSRRLRQLTSPSFAVVECNITASRVQLEGLHLHRDTKQRCRISQVPGKPALGVQVARERAALRSVKRAPMADEVVVEEAVLSGAHLGPDKDASQEGSAFECNICYDLAQSPVVTMCGHLYCWPCLYRSASAHVNPSCMKCRLTVEAYHGADWAGSGQETVLTWRPGCAGGCRCRRSAECVQSARRASGRTRWELAAHLQDKADTTVVVVAPPAASRSSQRP